ncbi:MAG: hypothetical protein M1453_06000 [Acidobacteria bacterium]|nr:hypothetical protein [Acidobacteriota bacterium]
MKARVFLGLVAVFLVVLLAVAADDPWKTANYQSWSDKDVQKVLKDSPWGREIVTRTTDAPRENRAKPSNSTVNQYDQPEPIAAEWVQVEWWSAKTVRRAVLRKAMLKGVKFPEDQAKAFTETPMEDVVIVLWADPKTLAALARMEPAELMKTAYLDSPRLKTHIEPIDAAPVKEGNSPPDKIRFHFARKLNGEDIVTDKDSRLVFKWRLLRNPKGKVEDAQQFEVVFNPSKMLSGGAGDY